MEFDVATVIVRFFPCYYLEMFALVSAPIFFALFAWKWFAYSRWLQKQGESYKKSSWAVLSLFFDFIFIFLLILVISFVEGFIYSLITGTEIESSGGGLGAIVFMGMFSVAFSASLGFVCYLLSSSIMKGQNFGTIDLTFRRLYFLPVFLGGLLLVIVSLFTILEITK